MYNETKELNPVLLSQYNAVLQMSQNEPTEDLKEQFSKFENISNISEAKELLKEIFPKNEGKSLFLINGVEISIHSKSDLFRISADFADEFILYEYNK